MKKKDIIVDSIAVAGLAAIGALGISTANSSVIRDVASPVILATTLAGIGAVLIFSFTNRKK